MRLEHVTSAAHPMYPQAMALYKMSFPPYEQREAPSQERILEEDDYNFALVYDGNLFVGLVLYWETAEYLYIEHFCILQTLRNRRYGQRTLELLAERARTLILEIDPPTDEIACRQRRSSARCRISAAGNKPKPPAIRFIAIASPGAQPGAARLCRRQTGQSTPCIGRRDGVYDPLEAQNRFHPGYPLLKRAIYYGSRMNSAQYGTEFTKSEYGNIKKVCSLWICSHPPKDRRNTITRYSIREEPIVGEAAEEAMQAVNIPQEDRDRIQKALANE